MTETGSDRLRRARSTAVAARSMTGAAGLVVGLTLSAPPIVLAGFALVVATTLVPAAAPRAVRTAEESAAALATVLIVGAREPVVDAITLLWLCAAVSGVVSRGGRVHWIGRAILVFGLALPVALDGGADVAYLGFVAGALGLLLTSGRVTREMTGLLAEARYDADHDRLTGALSSEALRDWLDATLRRREPVRVVRITLIELRGIARTRGHVAGDAHVVAAATALEAQLRDGDQLGRLGTDELVVVARMPGGADEERLLAGLGAATEGPILAAVGVAVGPTDGADADAVLRAADIALQVAKRDGGHRLVRYEGEELTDDPHRGARGALARLIRGEGLAVAMQPIVDLTTGEVYAYEALARFRVRGIASPLHWFALAGELGMRDDLELAALRAALDLFAQRPPGVRLSVNVSPALLGDERLLQALDAHRISGGLIVEVTEDRLVEDDVAVQVALAPLAARGVIIAIDDVGAGYAGLGQLAALRPGIVKLDRRLIEGVDTSPHRAALVEALVGYANRTGVALVAEGIERPEQLDAVRRLGVTLVQGYLLGRPGPPWPEVEPVSAYAAVRQAAGVPDAQNR